MSMTLYHGEPNAPSLSVLAALFEKRLDARLVRIDLGAAERHRLDFATANEVAMSVEGEGPVLVVDGEAMADSVFIGCFLDDLGPGTPLRPSDPYARWEVMRWCRQMIERTAPAAAYLGCHAHPPKAKPADIARVRSEDLRTRWQQMVSGAFEPDKLEDSRTKIADAVNRIEARLEGRDWLVGEFSIADLESYGWLAGMAAIVSAAFDGKARTRRWLERVRARPAVERALALASVENPLTDWAPGPEINRWG